MRGKSIDTSLLGPRGLNPKLIAPCGMNCNLCSAYLREKRICPGCRARDENKPNYRVRCIIKNCEALRNSNRKYCSEKCVKFPCQRLTNIDKRYRTKYGMSMIENLNFIKDNGIREFIENEKKRWVKEDKIFCVHKKKYLKYT
jgi:hypothetical protein